MAVTISIEQEEPLGAATPGLLPVEHFLYDILDMFSPLLIPKTPVTLPAVSVPRGASSSWCSPESSGA